MADFDQAFDYLMRWEDDGLTGRVTRDAGGRTRYGIAERYHADLAHTGFYDTMPNDEALQVAKGVYFRGEWHVMHGADISSQELANKMLSLGVDLGIVAVIRWAQEAVHVDVDGQVGPITRAAWNSDSASPFHAISLDAEAHYRQRADEDSEARQYLKGWIRRAQDPATLEVS